MTRSSRPGWTDVVVAGLLAVLTGWELLNNLRRTHSAPRTSGHEIPNRVEDTAGELRRDGRHSTYPPDKLPPGVHLVAPSVWPMVLGGGLTLLLFGVVTTYFFMAIGILLIVASLVGWIGELVHAGAE